MAKATADRDKEGALPARDPSRALDAAYYTDPAIFAREKERLFFRTWQYAGHVSQIVAPGDYFTFQLFDQSLFTIRDGDGEIRTFFNVCMHRAHELVQGSGNKPVLICPYHAWTYELDGRLRKAPNDQNVPGFDRSTICLTGVRTEVLCGFIFVNLDADAPPIAACFPDVETELRDFLPAIDQLKPLRTVPVEEQCNWKVSVENYNECYHCGVAHPTFVRGVIDPKRYNVMPQGQCLRHTTCAVASDKMTYAIDHAANPHAGDYSSWFLWPAFSFQVYPGGVLNTYHWRPMDVGTTLVCRGWYAADDADAAAIDKLAEQDRTTTLAEDVALVNAVQRGLNSRGYRPGPLVLDPNYGVNSEHSVKALHDWLQDALDA